VDAAKLFADLQLSNQEMVSAYESTLEGWARALELRERETEGHSRRVVDLTVHLAEAMGIPAQDLDHLRRGALLHDIGKMGIPDAILHKPGSLTPLEWSVMRQHPQYAYDLLAPIAYLKPAASIPYCHHEKWDGTGYPRGLKGEEIPLPARIFAIVDVFDALSTDRPYRLAWAPERVRNYIIENRGRQFDPRVVDAFLELIARGFIHTTRYPYQLPGPAASPTPYC
jgi:putative nucleotidyltransferase with HDIG domain